MISPKDIKTPCLLALALSVVVGCASSQEAFEAPVETRPPVVTDAPGAEPEPPSEPESDQDDGLTVVIEEGESETTSARRSLLEAAEAERERRRTAPQPQIVITNDNLAEYATGELTLVEEGAGAAAGSEQPDARERPEAEDVSPDREAYWRTRIRQARLDWKLAVEEVDHLQDRVAELRRRFYEEDDPYYRDSQIKPSWDRALERLAEARDSVELRRLRVEEVLDEGRRAGALPGWLREGIELEPKSEEENREEPGPEHEPREPSVVEPVEPPAES